MAKSTIRKSVVLAAVLIVSWLFALPSTLKKSIASSAFKSQAPVFFANKAFGDFMNYLVTMQITKSELLEHCQNLARENAYLKIKQVEFDEERKKFSKLHKLDNLSKTYGFHYELANVCGRNVGTWTEFLCIDKGQDDGIQAGFGVINECGVVGKVAIAYSSTAIIELITNKNFRLVVVEQSNECPLLLHGVQNISMYSTAANIANIPDDFDPILPAKIVTSQLSGQFPYGINVGTLVKIKSKHSIRTGKVSIDSFIRSVNEVSVLIPAAK